MKQAVVLALAGLVLIPIALARDGNDTLALFLREFPIWHPGDPVAVGYEVPRTWDLDTLYGADGSMVILDNSPARKDYCPWQRFTDSTSTPEDSALVEMANEIVARRMDLHFYDRVMAWDTSKDHSMIEGEDFRQLFEREMLGGRYLVSDIFAADSLVQCHHEEWQVKHLYYTKGALALRLELQRLKAPLTMLRERPATPEEIEKKRQREARKRAYDLMQVECSKKNYKPDTTLLHLWD